MAVAPGPGERLCRRGVYRPLAPRRGGKGLMSMEGCFLCAAGADGTGRSRYLKRSVCAAEAGSTRLYEGSTPAGGMPRERPRRASWSGARQSLRKGLAPSQLSRRWIDPGMNDRAAQRAH